MSRNVVFGLAFVFAVSSFTAGQEQPAPGPYTCTMLSSARTQEAGCYIIVTEKIDHLPAGPLFWHLYNYPTLEQAKRGQQESGGIVAESQRDLRGRRGSPVPVRQGVALQDRS